MGNDTILFEGLWFPVCHTAASDSLSARIAQYEPAIRILEAFAPDREWCPKAELVGWDPYANSGFHVDNIDTDYLHLKQSYGR